MAAHIAEAEKAAGRSEGGTASTLVPSSEPKLPRSVPDSGL